MPEAPRRWAVALITATEASQLPAECPRSELAMREGRLIAAAPGSDAAAAWTRGDRRRAPRRLGDALGAVRAESAPATPLAAVQSAWPGAAGEAVAAQAEPVSERGGVITVACRSATWAQELDLLGPQLLERVNAALEEAGSPPVDRLRFTARSGCHDV